jgi:processive 1,2-diacylglycerol beta-glucosyltransferase
MANALQRALLEAGPDAQVKVVDGLEHCAAWFHLYYNSYLLPMRYWPSLWRQIENLQHRSAATSPGWLYRQGGRRLFHFIKAFDPDIVVATEVGLCELAAMLKRESGARFRLVGLIPGVDADRPWAQPEVDLYPVAPGEVVKVLEAAGVPRAKILPCGMPIDPLFNFLPERAAARTHLGITPDIPVLLVLFGGEGYDKPRRRILKGVERIQVPLQVVLVVGRNAALEHELRGLYQSNPRYTVLGWVDNMYEWMAAADLLLGKPGGGTVIEALTCGLPLLAFDPRPGDEERACLWIAKQRVGHWIKHPEDIAPTVERLLNDPEEMRRLRANALALARPRAAYDAAEAILRLR